MSEKFTQGEWRVDNVGLTGDIFDVTFNADGECVAEHVHTEADAHLISQAPAMYRMLEEMDKLLTMLDIETHPQIELDCVCYDINQLLAKARGENVN